MLCRNCGMNVEDGILFCPNCGSKVTDVPKMPDMENGNMTQEQENENPVQGQENENLVQGQGNENPTQSQENGYVQAGTGMVQTNFVQMQAGQYGPKKICPNCGMANNMNDAFCQNCRFFFGNPEADMGQSMGMGQPPKKKNKALLIALPIGIAVFLIALLCICVPPLLKGLGGKTQAHDFLLYIKDNELVMAKSGQYEPMEIGEKFYEDKDDADIYAYYSSEIQYSPDNSYIYYPHSYDAYDSDYDLYRRNLANKKAEEEKIDSDVVYYEIIDNNKILYIKDWDDRKLYLYDKGESIKITSDALWAHASDDGKYMIWETDDEDSRLYVQDIAMKDDKIKLDSDIYTVYAYSSDLNTIVYNKDDNLYLYKNLEEKEKIASDVEYVYIYGSGDNLRIYYIKEGDEIELSVYDLIDDDCLSHDENMKEPRYSDYETSDEYYDAWDEYYEKENRDDIREYLKSVDLSDTTTEIYYYDAKSDESTKVMDGIILDEDSIASDTALMYCWSVDVENVENAPKLSDFTDMSGYEAEEETAEALFNSIQVWYIKEGELVEIPNIELSYMDISSLSVIANENIHTIYLMYDYYTDDYEDYYTELYSYDYDDEDAELELVCDEVYFVADWFVDEIYYVNEDDELYRGDTKIDDDVYAYSIDVQEDGTVLYLVDIDKDEEEGTLKMYQDGETVKIADDVALFGYKVFEQNKIAFLEDYNFNKDRGELSVYDGKDIIHVDSDVTCIALPY